MIHTVEELFQIHLHYLTFTVFKVLQRTSHSLVGGASRTKSETAFTETSVIQQVQLLGYCLLYQTVGNGRYAQHTFPSVGFRYLHLTDCTGIYVPHCICDLMADQFFHKWSWSSSTPIPSMPAAPCWKRPVCRRPSCSRHSIFLRSYCFSLFIMLYTWSYSSIYARECYALACRPFCFQHTLSTGSPFRGWLLSTHPS